MKNRTARIAAMEAELRARGATLSMGDDLDGTIMHVDLIGTGSEEDIASWLRYYATEQDRDDWVRQFPDYDLPPREKPPFDRDRLLPKAHEVRAQAP